MRPKSLTSLAAVIAAGALVLPACGGGDEADSQPAADSVPREEVQGVERRVGELEKEIERLRQDLEGMRNEQSSAEDAGEDKAAARPGGADDGAGGGAAAGRGGSSAGSGSGGGSGVRPLGAGDEGGGPDPGTREDDPTVEDICGENPHPTC